VITVFCPVDGASERDLHAAIVFAGKPGGDYALARVVAISQRAPAYPWAGIAPLSA
jgi:hypothetical protein